MEPSQIEAGADLGTLCHPGIGGSLLLGKEPSLPDVSDKATCLDQEQVSSVESTLSTHWRCISPAKGIRTGAGSIHNSHTVAPRVLHSGRVAQVLVALTRKHSSLVWELPLLS